MKTASKKSGSNEEQESMKLLYTENSNFNRYIMDWRGKVLVRFSLTVAALIFVAKWIAENPTTTNPKLQALPLFLASFYSFFSLIMDIRNRQIMDASNKAGALLEEKIGNQGYYQALLSIERKGASYRLMFNLIYAGSSILFLVLSFIYLFK